MTLSSLRRVIGVVPQDPVLFNTSLEYNIAYGQPSSMPPPESTIIASALRKRTTGLRVFRRGMRRRLKRREVTCGVMAGYSVTPSLSSNSTFGTSIFASAPLGLSSLHRAFTLTPANLCNMRVDAEGDSEDLFKISEFRRSGGYSNIFLGATVGAKVEKAPTQPATPKIPSTRKVKTPHFHHKFKFKN